MTEHQKKEGHPAPVTHLDGWTGNKCEPCEGHGVRIQDGEERRCPDCAGTGDEYGPKLPSQPNGERKL